MQLLPNCHSLLELGWFHRGMNPTSIDVGDILERCNREVVRFPATLHGDVRVHKGEGATLYYEQFRTEVRWFSEQGEEISDEKTSNDFPFNVIRVSRDAEGKKMHLMFFSEHDDYANGFDALDEADFETDDDSENEAEGEASEHPPEPTSSPEPLPPAA